MLSVTQQAKCNRVVRVCAERMVISVCVYTAGENNFVYRKIELIVRVSKVFGFLR